MAERLEVFTVTCPANTPSNIPVSAVISFTPGHIHQVGFLTPNVVLTTAGISLTQGGVSVLPRTLGAWIQGQNTWKYYATKGFPNSGSFGVLMWNTNAAPQSWNIEFDLNEIVIKEPASILSYQTPPPKDFIAVDRLGSRWVPA